jgi:hypothetical protein
MADPASTPWRNRLKRVLRGTRRKPRQQPVRAGVRRARPGAVSKSKPDDRRFQFTSPEDREIIEAALPYTMTSVPRVQAVIDGVRYCQRRAIPGALAECGVWRGGSVLAMALTLIELGATDRDLYLFDTFEGMTKPTERDASLFSEGSPVERWEQAEREGKRSNEKLFHPDIYGEEQVRETMLASGYPAERIKIVRGPVEETVPASSPERLALLRLDTDYYESTKHELEHLYPVLAPGGVLIIDDYGFMEGAREAVDEYFSSAAPPVLLHRIDFTGRIAIKH